MPFHPQQSLFSFLNQTRIHRWLQYGFMLFYTWVAARFVLHVLWAYGKSQEFVPRPPSVEAFLPIGAFLAFKRFLLTGEYDMVHPAGLTIFMFALGVSFLLRRSFCGYLCPIGGLTGLVQRLGAALGIQYHPGKLLSAILSVPKYLLMMWITWRLVLSLDLNGINSFLGMQYWRIADTKMLLYFWHPTTGVLIGLAVIAAGNLVIPGFWCRGLCPYGALLGVFSMCSPVAVRRKEEQCTGCRRCTHVCPARIAVHEKTRVSGPECFGCGECVGACPEKETLAFTVGYTAKSTAFPAWYIPALTLFLLALAVGWATETGRWYRIDNLRQVRMDHMMTRPDWLR